MRNTRNRRAAMGLGWRIGLGGSVLTHALALGALFAAGRRADRFDMARDEAAPTVAITPIEMTAVDRAELGDPPLPADVAPPAPRPFDAREGDRDNAIAVTVAPSTDDGVDRAAPAPDQGAAGGAPPDHAYRRDRSILHGRLTDGAAEAMPARLRTSRRPASPQAIRREPVVGIGDAVRTRTPARAAGPPTPHAARALALGGEPGGAAEVPSAAAAAAPPSPAPEVAAQAVKEHTVGPLDAEPAPRSFDVERPGPASDNQTMRTASNERHPGLTDFSRPAAPAPSPAAGGRGPGAAPGAVARPAAGSAAAALGAPDARAPGPEVEQRMRDRRYQRYIQEIKKRVDKAKNFPKALALRLEQGETIVWFEIGTDGRFKDGPRVVKSSGFEEFDTAALQAVKQAAPFPPMPDGHAQPLAVSMQVTFDNPVIR